MLIFDEVLTADGATTGATWKNSNNGAQPFGTVSVYGPFGGGTATFQSSPDGGSTWIDVLDSGGLAVSFIADGEKNFQIASSSNDPIPDRQRKLRVDLVGSTSPSLTIRISDAT